MKSIIVGTDGSENSIAAARWASGLAARSGARLTVVYSWQPSQAELPPDAYEKEAEEAQASVEKWCREVGDLQGEVECVARDGDAIDILMAEYELQDADLLVVGRRGVGGFRGLVLGSIADYMLHHGPEHTAIVPDEVDTPGSGPVLAGVDGSGDSVETLRWAAQLAADAGREVQAIFTYDPREDSFPHPPRPHRHEAEARAALTEVAGTAAVPLELEVVAGNPTEVLMSRALEVGAIAVVVGARGHHTLRHRSVGHVAGQLAHHCPAPIVVVRHQD
ncbi:MAG TPA: universal stress protein [Acidimicrobiales bacterium]|nr:universal stress protein [Acidimicrobiales bacterium]